MKRWDFNQLLATSRQLFAKVMKRKRLVHHRHFSQHLSLDFRDSAVIFQYFF